MSAWEKVNHGPVNGVRVGRFNKGINTTFVVYAYQDVLIDAGPSNQWSVVSEFIAKNNINHLLLTHHHEDHTGNAGNIKQHYNISVHSNKLCQQMVNHRFKIPTVQKLIWGAARSVDTELLNERFVSNDGVNFDIILTPGHTDDMSCFHDKEHGFLFTGDLYIASKVRYLHKDEDLGEQLNSLNKVLALDFDTAFCPHRGIMKNGKQNITKKRDFIIDLASQAQDLAIKGLSSKKIQKKLLGREGVLALTSNFDFSKKGLIEGCLKLSL